jgi:peptidoglycan-associated lipoprotein
MRKNGYRIILLLMFSILFAGCAATYKTVDLNPQIISRQLVQKTDNFIILFDYSASMGTPYGRGARLDLARTTKTQMVQTIPDLKLIAGLRTFWGDQTDLEYGMVPFNKADLLKKEGIFKQAWGRTPLEQAIAVSGEDIKPFPGNSAVIIISDFEDLPGIDDIRPINVIENAARLKAQYGDRVCLYTIQIGQAPGGKALTQAIVQEGKCGFDVNADELATPAAMAAFVEKVFLGPPPPAAQTKPAEEGAMKAAEAKAEAEAAPASPITMEAAAAPAGPITAAATPALENIHFDFDKSALRAEDREILKKHAAWLMKNKDYSLVIEGNCDERGTTEYNLALGERRAEEAKKYLVALGVDEKRIKTISYGKEKPLDPGHTEEAWAKNRRDQFVLNAEK